MLTMRFNPKAEWGFQRLTIDPPYELVGRFITSDVQGSVHVATSYAKRLREVVSCAREPIECETGNVWTMDADPEWTTLTNTYGTAPLTVRLPTSWLLDAVERWRQHLIDLGYPLDQ
jgi:hypothetical protein